MTGGAGLPAGTQFVDAFVFDLNGVARGKRLPAQDWAAASTSGVAFSASALVLDAQGNAQGPLGIGTTDGDPDAVGLPVSGQIWPVPWATAPLAQVLLTMRGAHGALWFDPREILAGVVALCRADGLHPVVACELEFYLVQTDAQGRPSPPRRADSAPQGSAGHLCLQRVEDHGEFLHRLHAALAAQGIEAGTLVSEYGHGQFEVNLRHTSDPVLAADQAALLRRATQGMASRLGQRASFMAKPYPDQPGSGLHVHVSLVDEHGRNRFGASGGQTLLEQAVGGMQALLADSMAVFAPNFSAYRRYRAGAFVSTDGGWGENDRRAAFRIPMGNAASRRVEHRVAGADASPHLVMACVLAGLHHGVMRQVAPVQSVSTPRDITHAIAQFGAGETLRPYLPTQFQSLFSALKTGELSDLQAVVADREFAYYL